MLFWIEIAKIEEQKSFEFYQKINKLTHDQSLELLAGVFELRSFYERIWGFRSQHGPFHISNI